MVKRLEPAAHGDHGHHCDPGVAAAQGGPGMCAVRAGPGRVRTRPPEHRDASARGNQRSIQLPLFGVSLHDIRSRLQLPGHSGYSPLPARQLTPTGLASRRTPSRSTWGETRGLPVPRDHPLRNGYSRGLRSMTDTGCQNGAAALSRSPPGLHQVVLASTTP